jgi:hypothetical protein
MKEKKMNPMQKNNNNNGKTWTDEEQKQLRSELQSGMSVATISNIHGRSQRAIELRIMGMISREFPNATKEEKKTHLMKTYRRNQEDSEQLLSLTLGSENNNFNNFKNMENMGGGMGGGMNGGMHFQNNFIKEMKEQTELLRTISTNIESMKRHLKSVSLSSSSSSSTKKEKG